LDGTVLVIAFDLRLMPRLMPRLKDPRLRPKRVWQNAACDALVCRNNLARPFGGICSLMGANRREFLTKKSLTRAKGTLESSRHLYQ
jgi:hypothetical protein